MPRASIIIPAYNAADYIAETINSVLTQTFSDFECIIIDDGSTDQTVSVVKRFNDPRIKLIEQENSGGPAKPRNVGLKHATGDYIFMFDADDLMLPDKLEASIRAMEQFPHAGILFTNFLSIDSAGIILKDNFLDEYQTLWGICCNKQLEEKPNFISSATLHAGLIGVNFIGTSSVVLRHTALTADDQFNEELKNSDDRLFWITFSKKNSGVFLNQRLHKYRILQTGISNQGFDRRGLSKVKALELALTSCDNVELRQTLRRQIAEDYERLAYANMKKGKFKSQVGYAVKSLRIRFGIGAAKLAAWGLLRWVIQPITANI